MVFACDNTEVFYLFDDISSCIFFLLIFPWFFCLISFHFPPRKFFFGLVLSEAFVNFPWVKMFHFSIYPLCIIRYPCIVCWPIYSNKRTTEMPSISFIIFVSIVHVKLILTIYSKLRALNARKKNGNDEIINGFRVIARNTCQKGKGRKTANGIQSGKVEN